MFLGLVLEFLTLITHADLHEPSSGANSMNKFLITDGLLRKAGLRENHNSSGVPLPPSEKPSSGLSPTVIPNDTQPDLTTKGMLGNILGVKMELMQQDGRTAFEEHSDKNTTGIDLDELGVNQEHLVGQFLVCDPDYERHCSGSHCVQIFEGASRCVVDRCRGKLLISCRNGRGCYSQDQHCDEVADCDDASDEMNCLTLVQVHDERHFYTRTVPFMAILCLMGVAASFVLYHQTNAARQRQRHLSMVGLTNALTTAGLAQRADSHAIPRWRTRDGPSAGLLGDLPEVEQLESLEAVGISTQQLEQMGGNLHDFEHLVPSAQQLQLLAGSPDVTQFCDEPLDGAIYTGNGRFHNGYRGFSADLSPTDCNAPPSYETALEMGTVTNRDSRLPDVTMDGDPPPYESVSHITCTTVVSMTDV